jgi:vacuolar-type H+-ATPase subunit I/STV1
MPETSNQSAMRKKNITRRFRSLTSLKKGADELQRKAAKIEEECAEKINKLRSLAKEKIQQAKAEEKSLTSNLRTRNFSRRNVRLIRPNRTKRNNQTQLRTPNSVVKKINIFVKSGRKGLTSEKGKAWHANIARARQNIQSFLQSQGITQKPTGTAAIKYASLLRKDPASAATFRAKIVEDMKSRIPPARPTTTRSLRRTSRAANQSTQTAQNIQATSTNAVTGP